MLYMLDIDTCIYIMRAKPSIVRKRFEATAHDKVCISIVTLGELAFGVSRSQRGSSNRTTVEEFEDRLSVFPWDEHAAWVYGDLRHTLERECTRIGALDTMIAAHALSLDAIIVTNNVRHFERVPDLRVENWLADASGSNIDRPERNA